MMCLKFPFSLDKHGLRNSHCVCEVRQCLGFSLQNFGTGTRDAGNVVSGEVVTRQCLRKGSPARILVGTTLENSFVGAFEPRRDCREITRGHFATLGRLKLHDSCSLPSRFKRPFNFGDRLSVKQLPALVSKCNKISVGNCQLVRAVIRTFAAG